MSCGFSSSQYFASVFRHEVGVSPGEFRIDEKLTTYSFEGKENEHGQ